MTWLLLLLPVVAIAAILWNYQRRAAAREAASAERFQELLAKPASAESGDGAGPASSAPVSDSVAPGPPVPLTREYAPRENLLTPPQKVLYYLLKAGLSDCEVLAKVGVATFVAVPTTIAGFERETRERRLALAVADFLVCDKAFRPMAVVQCRAAGGGDAAHLAFARECCASADVRWVDIPPDALPSRDTVRAVVLGA